MISLRDLTLLAFSLCLSSATFAADNDTGYNPLADLPMRHIGSALMSGRISDFEFYPEGNQ